MNEENTGPGEPPSAVRLRFVPVSLGLRKTRLRAVQDDSTLPYELGQQTLLTDEDEEFIRAEVERKLYEPELPSAGDKERKMIARFKKLALDREWAGCHDAGEAVTRREKLLPANPVAPDRSRNVGRYYIRKPITRSEDNERYEWLKGQVKAARISKEWDKKWFAEQQLEGMPEAVSDFHIECLFLLRTPDGKVERLVRLRNILGEVSKGPHQKGGHLLDSKSFASPEHFRTWCLSCGNNAWFGNQIAVQKLHQDFSNMNAWRVVNQVNSCGWYPIARRKKQEDGLLAGIWFCEGCAYYDGSVLRPDEDGIYWVDGEGYYLNRKGRESNFAQKKPDLKPDLKIATAIRTATGWIGTEQDGKKIPTDLVLYRGYFREVRDKFYDTLGGYEGHLCMGAIFAYAAAPELFEKFSEFPGLWLHGQMSSGKTKVAEWLMRICGYEMAKGGIGLLKASAVGLQQEQENYSNQPLLVDEYRAGSVKPEVEAVLRDAFGRQPAVKWTPDGVQRTMNTSFIVCGESTSSDSALRSRYPHVQVSSSKRIHNHLEWLDAQKGNFCLFFRLLMERRAEFVKLTLENLDEWLKSPLMDGVNEREKRVHGIDYAAMQAMSMMLDANSAEETAAFCNFMVAHAKGSAEDVKAETNINVFWSDLITAIKAGDIPMTCFRLEGQEKDFPPGSPNQTRGWKSYQIFMDPSPTMSNLELQLVKRRNQITLKRQDLRDQMSKSAGWIEGSPVKCFGEAGLRTTGTRAWGFDVDTHELGYRECSDAEVEAYYLTPELPDPRKGDLFILVQMLENEKKKAKE